MPRLVAISRFLLPLALAVVAAVLRISAGLGDAAGLVLVIGAGALLGWAAAVGLESVGILVGLVQPRGGDDDKLTEGLEREKEMVLRSIKDVELDAALGKVEADEAAVLAEPLKRRAMDLLRELDRAHAGHLPEERARTVDEQIEAEVARRLGGAGGAGAAEGGAS